jgi:hypothetical protein
MPAMPSAPVRPGDPVVLTIAPRRSARLLAAVYGGCALGIALFALAFRSAWALAVLVLGFLLFALLTIAAVRDLTFPTVVTSSQLITHAPLRGWRVIDLAQVTSVVMRCREDPETGDHWVVEIGMTGGRAVGIRVDEFPRLLGWTPPPESEDWQRLVSSTGGRVAAAIAAQVVAVQGPAGPFARSASKDSGSSA